MKNKLVILIVVLLGCIMGVRAQNVEYIAELDTNYMMIGDQIHLKMKVKADPGVRVVFPVLKDTIVNGVEVISGPVRDSIREKDGRMLIQEAYLITSFDSGVYRIPSLPIQVEKESYNNVLRTDPMQLIVNTYAVDQQKGNYDIVMPIVTPWTFAEILPYLLWVLLGLVILLLVWWIIKKRRANKPLFATEKPAIPPYDLAMKALNEIKEEKLWQSGKTKEYYTQLTDAIRNYLDGELDIPAMEQTSFETMRSLEGCREVAAPLKDKLGMMFETADFVKFAKAMPLPDENARNLDIAFEFVNHTNEQVQELKEREKQEKESREREEREKEEAARKEAEEGEEK